MLRWRTPVCAMVAVFALAACGGSDDSPSVRGQPKETVTTAKDSGTADDYVGLTKKAAIAKAESNGRPWRIGREDGESFPATLDYNPERVTFEIDDGTVTAANFG